MDAAIEPARTYLQRVCERWGRRALHRPGVWSRQSRQCVRLHPVTPSSFPDAQWPAWRHDHAWRDGVSQEYRSIASASNARCWCIAARKPGMVSCASGYPLPRARPATSRQPLIYQALAAQWGRGEKVGTL